MGDNEVKSKSYRSGFVLFASFLETLIKFSGTLSVLLWKQNDNIYLLEIKVDNIYKVGMKDAEKTLHANFFFHLLGSINSNVLSYSC
jgi:hypothetical protein